MKKTAVFLCGWISGFATVIVLYRVADWASSFVLFGVFFVAGLVIGYCARSSRWLSVQAGTFALASFFGVLTGMIPPIVVSYGFALVLLPVVALWSGMISFVIRSRSAHTA